MTRNHVAVFSRHPAPTVRFMPAQGNALGNLHRKNKSLFQIADFHAPRDFGFLALVPPFDEGRKLVELDDLGLGIAFLALGQLVFVIPVACGPEKLFQNQSHPVRRICAAHQMVAQAQGNRSRVARESRRFEKGI